MASNNNGSILVRIFGDSKPFDKAIEGTEQSVAGLGKKIAGAFAVKQVAEFAWETAKLAGKVQGVKEAFDNISTPGMLKELRGATKGAVSDLELMQGAVRANNFQIPLEQLGTLFEFASNRARQTGESVEYLTQSIIMGIGRKSPLILDNLGISAVRLREELKGVGVEAAGVGDVAKVIGKIITEENAKMAKSSMNFATQTERLTASWENLKALLGKGSASVLAAPLEAVVTKMQDIVDYANSDFVPAWKRILTVANDVAGYLTKAGLAKKLLGWGDDIKDTVAMSDAMDGYIKQIQASENKTVEFWNIYKKIYDTEGPNVAESFTKRYNQSMSNYIKSVKNAAAETQKAKFSEEDAKNAELQEKINEAQKKLNDISLKETPIEKLTGKEKELRLLLDKLKTIEATNKAIEEQKKKEIEKANSRPDEMEYQKYDPNEAYKQTTGIGVDQLAPQGDSGAYVIAMRERVAANEEFKASLESITPTINELGMEILQAGINSEEGLKGFGKAVVGIAKKAIAANIAVGVSEVVKGTLKQSSALGPFAIPIAMAAGGLAAAAFNSIIPSFSEGGMVSGPTLAMVGDNPSGIEYMIPKEKLDKLGSNNNSAIQVFGRISGKDILISSERAGSYREDLS